MRFSISKVVQAAIVAAILEGIAAAIRSHSFYPIPVTIYALFEFLFYIIVICIAAFVISISRISNIKGLSQRILFIALVVAPSIFSYYLFYRDVSYYERGGNLLVSENQITTAGIENFALNFGISLLIALVAAFIYFRGKHGAGWRNPRRPR